MLVQQGGGFGLASGGPAIAARASPRPGSPIRCPARCGLAAVAQRSITTLARRRDEPQPA
jgi:hypothetical protein